jgi:5-formaminoimidazole-4-carboxamide-1-beta-D-ribofuranosyl 5'-monophosphate synthetase
MTTPEKNIVICNVQMIEKILETINRGNFISMFSAEMLEMLTVALAGNRALLKRFEDRDKEQDDLLTKNILN